MDISSVMIILKVIVISIINTLNFFSAADLSQCNYEIIIRSSIPIDCFNVSFDIPVDVTPNDNRQIRQDSRDFSVDVEEDEDLAARFGVRNIPTVVFLKDGKEVDRNVGLAPRPVLEEKIKAML